MTEKQNEKMDKILTELMTVKTMMVQKHFEEKEQVTDQITEMKAQQEQDRKAWQTREEKREQEFRDKLAQVISYHEDKDKENRLKIDDLTKNLYKTEGDLQAQAVRSAAHKRQMETTLKMREDQLQEVNELLKESHKNITIEKDKAHF